MKETGTVLQVLAPGSFGGAETVVQGLSRGLADRGHSVCVAATIGPDVEEPHTLRTLRDAGVDLRVLRIPARRYDLELRGLGAIGRAIRPDVIHTHGYRSDLLGLAAARALHCPVLTTVHGYTGGDWKNRMYERLQRGALRHFDAVVAVSEQLASELRGSSRATLHLRTIRNAWCPPGPPLSRAVARARLGFDPDEVVVGWVGRVTPEKGCDLFLEAARILGDLDVRFSILGDGTHRPDLERDYADLNRTGRVQWHGQKPHAWSLLTAYDLLVLSSRTEGTPLVLLEAVYASVPVIATAVGGIPEMISDGEAWLVEPDPHSIAAALREAILDREKCRRRSHAAREGVLARHDPGRWLRGYEQVYAEISTITWRAPGEDSAPQ